MEVPQCGPGTLKSSVGSLGKKSPEAEAFCTIAHDILTPHGQKWGCPATVDTNGLTPLLGSGGCSASRVQGQSPCSGGLGAKHQEAESFSLHKWLTFA